MEASIIAKAAEATLRGTSAFPEIVSMLIEAGVEYYHVDYAGRSKSFFAADGSRVVTLISYDSLPAISPEFDAAALKAAILDSQRNGQKFYDFSVRAMRAGVQGYYAFLRGKRVTYFGRTGDSHTEWFPGAGPETTQRSEA